MENHILAQARGIYQQVIPYVFKRKNVVAVGLGYKTCGDVQTDDLSLKVSVTRKLPPSQLPRDEMIPDSFSGLPTDVVETGQLRAFMPPPRQGPVRPAPPGVSIGHYKITAGTFGLLVQRDGQPYILSNNHVLANSNDAQIGDPIYQPGPRDGGTADDTIAHLADFEPLDYGETPGECQIAEQVANFLNAMAQLLGYEHRLQPVRETVGDNFMDAALAEPLNPALVIPQILNLGLPTGITEPQLEQRVQKMGRTTGHTEGVVTQIEVTANINYNGRMVRFKNQVFTTDMSDPGDSGSGILDMQRRVVGLLFAGSDRVTIFTPIAPILERFNVALMVG